MISDKKNKYSKFDNFLPYLMETIDDLIILTSINDSFEIEHVYECESSKQLGYSNDTLKGKSVLELIYFSDSFTKEDLQKIIKHGNSKQDVQIINKDGRPIWTELTLLKFKDDKKRQKLFIRFRDLTKRKELELKLEESEARFEKISQKFPEIRFRDIFTPKEFDQALKESEAQLKTALESLPFEVFMIDKKGYYTLQNSTCKKNWGNLIGKQPEDVANNQATLAIWKNNNSRAFSGETVAGEVRNEINGEEHYFYNVINPVYIDNEIQYIIGINIDITEQKIAEQKVQESEEKFRLIYENTTDLVRVFNENFEHDYLNTNVHEQVLGYSKEDLDNIHPLS